MFHGRRSRFIAPGLMLAVGCLAGTLGVAGEPAAIQTSIATPPTIEELVELDEVVVEGTRLQDRIVKAEDRFFKLYNELNKNNDYDINCAYIPLDPDTRIQDRMCLPGFYANAIVETLQWGERCKGSQDAEGNYVPPPPCYTPPPPELVLLERSDKYARHVMSVIRSNPQLQEMAGELDALHMERMRLQRRYLQIKESEDELRASKPRYRPRIR